MKKISPLVLFVALTVFAQQQNTMPMPQDTLPEPVVPLVPAQPLPEEFIPIEPPQPPPPMLLSHDTLPLPPLPPLPPMPLPEDTLSTPQALPPLVDSTSIVSTPAPVPQDTTPVVPLPPPQPQDTIPQVVPTPAPTPTPTPVPQDTTPPKPSLPENTITVDLGPTIIGMGVGPGWDAIAKILGSEFKNVEISAFGIGAQYEFQPIRFFSLPLKFAYMDFDIGYTKEKTKKISPELPNIPDGLDPDDLDPDEPDLPDLPDLPDIETKLKAKLKADLSIYSIEAHPRIYPFGGSFFLEGMVGYANLSADFSGKIIASVEIPNIPDPDNPLDDPGTTTIDSAFTVNLKASRNYLKYGGKLGWRIDFGKPGGFIFEHALGFYSANVYGKTIVKQLANHIKKKYDAKPDLNDFDDLFSTLENWVFVGGIRYTIAFGWRF